MVKQSTDGLEVGEKSLSDQQSSKLNGKSLTYFVAIDKTQAITEEGEGSIEISDQVGGLDEEMENALLDG